MSAAGTGHDDERDDEPTGTDPDDGPIDDDDSWHAHRAYQRNVELRAWWRGAA